MHALALQVTLTLLRPSVIAITVSAFRLFTAQPYSLAILGSFNGTLASASNPAYTDGVVPVACGGPVTTVLTAPGRYLGQPNASFTFSADSGEYFRRLEVFDSCGTGRVATA